MEFFHESLIKTYDACHRVCEILSKAKKNEDETKLLLCEHSAKSAGLR